MRTTDYEFTRWVNMILDLVIEQVCIFRIFRLYPWNEDVDDILFDFRQHGIILAEIIVLC